MMSSMSIHNRLLSVTLVSIILLITTIVTQVIPRTLPNFMDETTVVAHVCPDQWHSLGETCIRTYSDHKTWNDARRFCQKQYKGDLVMIRNDFVNNVVKSMISKSNSMYWAGAKEDKTKEKFVMVNGEEQTFTKWSKGEPKKNAIKSTTFCISVNVSSNGWRAEDCKAIKNKFICEIKTQPAKRTCPDKSWKVIESKCVKIVTDKGKMQWDQARQTCQSEANDADLVQIENPTQNKFVQGMLQKQKIQTIWVGINDFGNSQDHVFKLLNGNALNYYASWADGQPDRNKDRGTVKYYENQNDCVKMGNDGKWYDETCDANYYFMCQVEAKKLWKTPVKPKEKTTNGCYDTTWKSYAGSCYKAFTGTSEMRSWSGARNQCRKYGGDLPGILNGEQNDFVKRMLEKNELYWTGFSDLNKEGIFSLPDGTFIGYAPWVKDYTRQMGNYDDCVAMSNTGWWNVYYCGIQINYVCQADKH